MNTLDELTGENRNTLLESALRYAERGFYVFPLVPKKKHPLTPHGFKDSTRNKEQIIAWWRQYPNANIGIATGLEYSNILVLDIDVGEGKDGWKALEYLQKRYGLLSTRTVEAKSGKGGTHYYYRLDEGQEVPCSSNKIGKDLDIRSEGGYIVAPPSLHPNGKHYTWIHSPDELELAPVPEAVLKAVEASLQEERSTPSVNNAEEITEGGRNDTLFRLAVKAHKDGASQMGIMALLEAENNRCSPPLPQKELETILKSAISYEKKKPLKSVSEALVPLSEVPKKKTEWLIHGWIPKNAIIAVVGDGGSGKTTLWCHLVAGLSSGNPTILDDVDSVLGIMRSEKKIVFFSSEDQPDEVLVWRLEGNKAKLENILHIPLEAEEFRFIKFKSDYLEELIKTSRPDVVVFDPLQGFLDHNTQMGARNHMRDEISRISAMCIKYEFTALIIMHTNKTQSTSARGRMADSADIWDAMRSVIFVGVDPTTKLRYISHEKTNYFKNQQTILFSIHDQGRIQHEGFSNKNQGDFQTLKVFENKSAPKRDEAINEILEYLRKEGGEMPVKELDEYLNALGYSKDVTKRAKGELKKMGVLVLEKDKEFQGAWRAKLSEDEVFLSG